ncbi:hypothetical protein AGMMS50276_32160 [Synergistales bacterium]|nr:hypothetical protein AGMMS50276_32160 [Synergistales bacterium]
MTQVLYFIKRGRNVQFFKVTSLDKWKSSNALPEEYKPENVVESMEMLLKTMKDSVARYRRTKFRNAVAAAIFIYLGIIVGCWGFDQWRWSRVQEAVNVEVASPKDGFSNFDKALESVNSFPERLIPPDFLLPKFLRVNADLEATRERIYVPYERAMYDALRLDVEGIDLDKIPNTADTKRFDTVANNVCKYIDQVGFSKIDPKHYENVKAVEGYYTIGQMMIPRSKENGTAVEAPKEIFGILNNALGVASQIPESWRDKFGEKVDDYTRQWLSAISREASIEALTAALLDVNLLVEHPKITASSL